jgi:hypothetical protein
MILKVSTFFFSVIMVTVALHYLQILHLQIHLLTKIYCWLFVLIPYAFPVIPRYVQDSELERIMVQSQS